MHLVHIFPLYLPMIRSNNTFPSTARSSYWFLTFWFSNQ